MAQEKYIASIKVALDKASIEDVTKRLDTITSQKREMSLAINKGDMDAFYNSVAKVETETKKLQSSLNITAKDTKTLISSYNQANNSSNRLNQTLDKQIQKLNKIRALHQSAFEDEGISGQFDKVNEAISKAQADTTADNVSNVKKQISLLSDEVSIYNNREKSLGEQLRYNAERFTKYVIGAQALFMTISVVNKMIDNVKELDNALVEIQKVTNLSGQALQDYTDKAFQVGETVGRTGTEVLKAAGDFARSGYALNETLTLAQEAATMLNVADEMSDISTASSTLISVMKAYNLQASQAGEITDTLNEVSNNAAISFDDLAEGISRSGAVYAQAGTSMGELTGLLTGANEVLQNIEKTSTGLVTISQRIRGIEEAGDEATPGVAKLGKDLEEIAGINLMDSEGQLRDTYDILKDLAEVYPTLTTNQRQYLGEQIAGKRQVAVLESLLTNWQSVDKAVQAAANSTGSATEEQERYLSSVEGKTQQMLSAFEQLSANTLDSNWLKMLLDASTAVIELTDNVGLLNVAFGAFVAYATFKNEGKPTKLWETLKNNIIEIRDNVKSTTVSLSKQDEGVKEILLSQKNLKTLEEQRAYLKKTETEYNEATLGLIHQQVAAERAKNQVVAVGKSLAMGLVGVLAGMALSAVISSATEAFHEWTHPIETAKENLDEISNELESANSELEGLKNSTKDLTPQEETRLQVLQAQTEQLKQQQELQAQETGKMQFKDTSGGQVERVQKYDGTFTYKYKVDTSEVDAFNAKLEDGTNYTVHADMSEIEDAKQTMIDAANAISEAGVDATDEQKEAYNQSVENYNEVATQYADIFAQMTALQEKGYVLSDTQSEALSNYVNYIDSSKDEISELTSTVDVLDNHYLSLTDTMDGLAESTDLLTTAWNEADTNGQLSLDTVMKLIDAGGQYMDLLVEENGVYKLNADAASALFEIQKQEKIADIEMEKQSLQVKIAATQAAIEAYQAGSAVSKGQAEDAKGRMQSLSAEAANILAAFGETSDGVNKALNKALKSITIKNDTQLASYKNALSEMQAKVGQYDKAINIISSLSLPSYTKATKGSTSASKKNSDATKKQNQELERLRNNLDKLKDDLSSTQEAYEAMQSAIIKQLEKEIELQEKRREELERLQEIYEAQQDKAQDIIKAEIDALQEQMDALDEKNDKEEEALKLKEAQLEAQKAQDAYDAAKANKSTRVYEEGVGWTWQANPEDVKEAEENLAEANKNLAELQKEQALAQKKQDIQGQIDELNELLEAWQTNLGDINDEIKNSSEVLDFATKFHNASLEERKQMLQQFTGSYVTEVDEQIKETDKQIDNLKDLKSQWQNAMDIQADISKYAGAQEWLRKFEQATYEQRKQMLSSFTNSWVSYYNTQSAKINEAQQAVDRMSGSMNNANNSGYNTSGLSNYRNATNQVAGAADAARSALSLMEEKAMASLRNTSNWINNLFSVGGKSSSSKRNFGGVSNFTPKITQRSANGNVDYFSSSDGGIIDYTGEWGDGKNWVDGTPNKPEVILNNDQAANVLYELAKAPNSRLADTTGGKNNKEMFVVNELNITANNQDTLQGLLLQAKQMAITK